MPILYSCTLLCSFYRVYFTTRTQVYDAKNTFTTEMRLTCYFTTGIQVDAADAPSTFTTHSCGWSLVCAYMNICIYSYIRTNIQTCIRAYVHTCILACIHTYIHAYMRTCMHAYMHTNKYRYRQTDRHTYTCIHMNVFIPQRCGQDTHNDQHAYTHAHTHTHTHINTHTHTYAYTKFIT